MGKVEAKSTRFVYLQTKCHCSHSRYTIYDSLFKGISMYRMTACNS